MVKTVQEIQEEALEVDTQIAQVLVDLNKWKTRKSELELEFAKVRQQAMLEQASQPAVEPPASE